MNSRKINATPRKRASSLKPKKDRRLLILQAAAEELRNLNSADDFTIDSLARRLGVVRGTIYIYFKDRNAIFLEILVDTINKFFAEITLHFPTLPAPVTSRKMARAFCNIMKEKSELRHLPQLLKSLPCSTEKKSGWIEKEIEPWRQQADEIIVRQLKGLQPGDGRRIMHFGWPLLLGFSEIIPNRAKTANSPFVFQQVEDGLTLIIDGLLARPK